MFLYKKEPREEQHLGTNDLKFREYNVTSVITTEPPAGSHYMVQLPRMIPSATLSPSQGQPISGAPNNYCFPSPPII